MPVTLNHTLFQPTGHYRTTYDVVLPGDQTVEEALNPSFWAHVGDKMRQHDDIHIFSEDGSRRIWVTVVSAGRGFANVRLLSDLSPQATEGEEAAAPDAPLVDLFVKWNGPHNKYAVIRKSDGEKLKTGFVEEVEAQRWMTDHLASLAR